jgi:DNA-binding NtrC family response regulator
VIERAVLLCTGGPITLEHLPVEKMGTTLPARTAGRSQPPPISTRGMPGRLGPSLIQGRGPGPGYPPSAAYADAMRSRGGIYGETHGEETAPTMSDNGPAIGDGAPDSARTLSDVPTLLSGQPMGPPIRSKVGAQEKNRILEALERCAGNQTKAARLLGMSRRTLVARLETYALPRPRKGSPSK